MHSFLKCSNPFSSLPIVGLKNKCYQVLVNSKKRQGTLHSDSSKSLAASENFNLFEGSKSHLDNKSDNLLDLESKCTSFT